MAETRDLTAPALATSPNCPSTPVYKRGDLLSRRHGAEERLPVAKRPVGLHLEQDLDRRTPCGTRSLHDAPDGGHQRNSLPGCHMVLLQWDPGRTLSTTRHRGS